MSTSIFYGQDRWVQAECEFKFAPDKINDLFSLELLTEYYINPDKLLIEVNNLIKQQWNNEYGQFEPISWGYDWSIDYKKLTDNLVNSSIFNIHNRNIPHDVDLETNGLKVETKTGLELALLNKWCNQRIHNSLIDPCIRLMLLWQNRV